MYVYINVYVYTYINVYIHICIYTYMHICLHTHTRTYTSCLHTRKYMCRMMQLPTHLEQAETYEGGAYEEEEDGWGVSDGGHRREEGTAPGEEPMFTNYRDIFKGTLDYIFFRHEALLKVYMSAFVYVYIYICIQIHLYIHKYRYRFRYIYIYTHI